MSEGPREREEFEAEGRPTVKECVYHSRARAGRCRVHAWVERRGTSPQGGGGKPGEGVLLRRRDAEGWLGNLGPSGTAFLLQGFDDKKRGISSLLSCANHWAEGAMVKWGTAAPYPARPLRLRNASGSYVSEFRKGGCLPHFLRFLTYLHLPHTVCQLPR